MESETMNEKQMDNAEVPPPRRTTSPSAPLSNNTSTDTKVDTPAVTEKTGTAKTDAKSVPSQKKRQKCKHQHTHRKGSKKPSRKGKKSSRSKNAPDHDVSSSTEEVPCDHAAKDVNTTSADSSSDSDSDDSSDTDGGRARRRRRKGRKSNRGGRQKGSKRRKAESDSSDFDSSDDESDSDSSGSHSSSSSSSSSDEESGRSKKRSKRKGRHSRKKAGRKHRRSRDEDDDDDDDDTDGDDEYDDEYDDDDGAVDDYQDELSRLEQKRLQLSQKLGRLKFDRPPPPMNSAVLGGWPPASTPGARRKLRVNPIPPPSLGTSLGMGLGSGLGGALGDPFGGLGGKKRALKTLKTKQKSKLRGSGRGPNKSRRGKTSRRRGTTLEFKRVDQLWDTSIHNYKLTESAEDPEDEFNAYIFTVRRIFDWENKYKSTVVDIKSKLLKEGLQEVMKDVKNVSLVEEQPCVDPKMLFLYLEELRTLAKKTLKTRAKTEKKRKLKRKWREMRAQCKLMVSYLDEDFEDTKKTLYPMLEAGNITFDLMWALFKPNTLAFASTYGSHDDPRAFKVDYATKETSFMRGEWYSVEGRYLEYDGKTFGLGEFEVQIEDFKGPRKITSLSTYPLQYHKEPEELKKQLLERGKRFVAMQGMNYRFHKGLAFMKKRKTIAKVNINGRIMIDPAIFRRINPNYPISVLKPKDGDEEDSALNGDDASSCGCGGGSSDDELPDGAEPPPIPLDEAADGGPQERTKFKVVFDKDKKVQIVEVAVDAQGKELNVEKLDKLPDGATAEKAREFTEEELIIASPVVLGFAFNEKLWLEFSLSGVRDIEWNEGAFDSLVLPANQKSIVKALVESHKFHAAKTIDDVVQGKGKGLVAVLHGPPGTGKTLTAEGIAELLKCPLYMVSAGELGTDPRLLEHELQKILDIAHSWGAVLLLDEADVFLEKREVHDIHRNALVSIFLRLLEYFQGILFLTTNRVETFDDAFQSRIHVALRYGELSLKAKRAVWKMFLEKVRVMEGVETSTFSAADYDALCRNHLNGRQIKNVVRTAQALAVNEKQALGMEHIKRVLEVAESFEQDLKGGTGYRDAMRQYT